MKKPAKAGFFVPLPKLGFCMKRAKTSNPDQQGNAAPQGHDTRQCSRDIEKYKPRSNFQRYIFNLDIQP
jgi:hypothetical protein